MNFDLTDEQRQIRSTVRAFAQDEVAPRAAAYDESGEFPYDLVAGMANLGLFALPFPQSVGGAGGDFLSYCLALEEIARADAAVAITLEAAVSLGISPIVSFGTSEQQERWLPELLAGTKLWAFGLTEAEAGSDAGGTRTRAERSDGEWVINGGKVFITNAGTEISAGVTVTAVTGNADGEPQISAIAVERGTPGYSQAAKYRKLGWHASDTRELVFADCHVPQTNMIGTEGGGYRQFLQILEGGRVAIAALSVGLAQACLDASLSYSVQRHQFGQPIARFQATQFKLADMATQIELSRLMTWRAAGAIDAGRSAAPYASMAKLHASEVATACANQAVQIHGGYGFMEESPVARYYRDVKVNEIGEGTSEVQRILIARHLLEDLMEI
ncbi:MAG: acyl-CoA dehydrogenase family protein [Candidatus Dormibacteraeota bacterium]|uniref:Acyl-CoA dehydrogenase n=1 Tax=Candidatus Aeolococcus gillhamiae TaxID=3127015 RepID=A0A2W5ZIX9_9BACT|nr:acyl-CoA dehydrogenase family protein [Candidatus Dormibacteraeota bacterium]PZR82756.1 MAG: acyl-CoA dehydrogenase [Candidatus Dormibacter sp. RRmetagenome_bin12]